MTSSPPARSFDWGNLRLRIVSGLVLAAVGAAGVILGGAPLLVLVAVAVALLSLEWGRMCATRDRKSTRLNSSHSGESRMPSSA